MTVHYLVEMHPDLIIGMALGDWGIGITVNSRELNILLGPFFVWWVWR